MKFGATAILMSIGLVAVGALFILKSKMGGTTSAVASPAPLPQTGAASATARPRSNPLVWDQMEKTVTHSDTNPLVEFAFSVTNTSQSEVVINELAPSCHCTTTSRQVPWKLAPGANGVMQATIDTRGRSRNVLATIAVDSTAGEQTLTLRIKAPAAVEGVNPLIWDATEKTVAAALGDTKAEFTFWVTNISELTDVTISRFYASCDCTSASRQVPWKLAPGGSGPVKAEIDLTGKTRPLTQTITVTSSGGYQTLTLNVN